MKRVKITGFSDSAKPFLIEEFEKIGLSFPVFGMLDEPENDLHIDGDHYPWAASAFECKEVTPTPTNPS